ncbi:MAG TPA: 50S ribosomal protein L15 [Lacipirellulaceae bacterium]|jgi:large subunit ribosomal protein L15|nr:50S ribosomal protein L15 [Lacipirellulaceae bacterium]
MNLNDIHRGVHTAKPRKRLGRGIGSGQGKTAGRGHKGQWAHNGVSFSPIFQGGASPLVRRIPKRGFNNRWAKTVAIVNLGDLNGAFKSGDMVNPESLAAAKLVNGVYDVLKILGNGEVTKKLKISAHRFSKTASEKISAAGGEAIVLPGPAPVVKQKPVKKKK